jgi:hypothetical protein
MIAEMTAVILSAAKDLTAVSDYKVSITCGDGATSSAVTGKNPPLTGRFFVKPLGKALARVGAGAVWMRGGGLYGRPLLEEARPVTSPPQRALRAPPPSAFCRPIYLPLKEPTPLSPMFASEGGKL